MAQETLTSESPPAAPAQELSVVVEKPQVTEKEPQPSAPAPLPEPEVPEKPAVVAVEEEAVEVEKPKVEQKEETKITQSVSFKEETNIAGELPEPQKKALDELKQLIQEALNNHEFTAKPEVEEKPVAEPEPKKEEEEENKEEKKAPAAEVVVVETEVAEKAKAVDDDGAKTVEAIEESVVAVAAPPAEKEKEEPSAEVAPQSEETKEALVPSPPPEEVSIWGIPLLADEKSDVILLKFLRARDFKVKDAFTMIKNTVSWRKEFGIETLLDEDLGNELEKVVFMQGFDKEGHPVCYNVYGEFQNKELYQNTFADEEKRSKFLRWRIQFLEKSIRKLDFNPTGINTMVQVNDLKNSPGPGKKELRQATNQALNLLQDNYPEFVAKQVFINVPWWYLAFNRMISPFLTQRTKSKFVFASPAKSAETLFKYIAPEQVPVQYGGLSREGEQEFSVTDAVTEVTIKPAAKHSVEFPITENCNLVWELRVVGWEVNYGAEFVPTAEDGYTVIVSKTRKVSSADETVISDSFKTGEPGKVVLTIDNQTSKKKKLLYRSKTKPYSD
ncbi:hypothetical protein Golax_008779 [Gossypium laxum]|uniref:Patellin-3 n=1 Tax=Gossypium laxum TaxID=34288 RepID=A0A7J9AB38_9ROSI|nr:hypothetical protein [Gossypium laxum]